MNISEIWKFDDVKVASILKANNLELSSNRNYDKVLVSTIFDNEDQLDAKSAEIVQIPGFNEIMTNTKDYQKSLVELASQYKLTIIQVGSTILYILRNFKNFSVRYSMN